MDSYTYHGVFCCSNSEAVTCSIQTWVWWRMCPRNYWGARGHWDGDIVHRFKAGKLESTIGCLWLLSLVLSAVSCLEGSGSAISCLSYYLLFVFHDINLLINPRKLLFRLSAIISVGEIRFGVFRCWERIPDEVPLLWFRVYRSAIILLVGLSCMDNLISKRGTENRHFLLAYSHFSICFSFPLSNSLMVRL
jgi:hypothetical protein